MQVFISPRSTGKTSRMITWLINGFGSHVLVVADEPQVRAIYNALAKELGVSVPEAKNKYKDCVITMHHFLNGVLNGHRNIKIGFDNLDMCVQTMTQHEVAIATIRG